MMLTQRTPQNGPASQTYLQWQLGFLISISIFLAGSILFSPAWAADEMRTEDLVEGGYMAAQVPTGKKVPELQGGASYYIYYNPPASYLNSILLFKPGKLEGMSFKQRASLLAGLQAAPDFRGDQRGMVLGVQPKNLTPEEKQKIRDTGY